MQIYSGEWKLERPAKAAGVSCHVLRIWHLAPQPAVATSSSHHPIWKGGMGLSPVNVHLGFRFCRSLHSLICHTWKLSLLRNEWIDIKYHSSGFLVHSLGMMAHTQGSCKSASDADIASFPFFLPWRGFSKNKKKKKKRPTCLVGIVELFS